MARMGDQLELSPPSGRTGRMAWAERHLSWLYWACAVALSPWVVFLYITQAPRAEAHKTQTTAVGLMLIALLALFLKTMWVGLWLLYRPVPALDGDRLPTVTAIVPAYNEGAMARHALQSLAACDYPKEKLQIIAVDDGSRDETYEHMQAAARLYPGRILLLRLPHNRGKRN